VSEDDKFSIPEVLEEWVGLKKSEYLSRLIENLAEGDFGFEEFHQFDHKLQETVEHPDRSYEETIDGYTVQTYVRTYSDEKMFHQIVIGTVYEDKKNEVEVFLPILTFVTRSEELAGLFCVGSPKTRPTLN
jgi:hypothetical protein